MFATIFSKRTVIAAMFLLLGALSASGRARAQDWTDKARQIAEAESAELIEKCWAISQEDRDSGNTPRMRSGTVRSAACMEEVILDLTERILDPDVLSRDEMRRRLYAIRDNYEPIIWDIYNGNKAGWQGTYVQLFHAAAYAHLLEGLIEKMVSIRVENRL